MEQKMQRPLVSIIVPVYEVEEYLDKCVQSLLSQSMRDIEIILVDDGSPDGCGRMCDGYADADPRVRVIHKKNGGLSDARNHGIDAAQADLIAFIDSDDYVDEDMIETLYNALVKEDADVSVCGFYQHYTEKVTVTEDRIGYCTADTYDAVRLELTEVPVSAVNKIYKKELFDEVRFPVGKLYEDAHTTVPVIMRAKKVVYDLKPKYHYIHRENSITTKRYRPAVKSLIEANKNNMELVVAAYPHLRKAAEYRYLWSYYWVLEYMLQSDTLSEADRKEKKEMMRFLKRNTFRVVFNPYFRKARKIAALVLMFSSRAYESLALKYIKKNYSTPSPGKG
ncbi:MAG: glycosyltransferase family 2 protein [Firmicutes bacterium]|nr:glycosyltransferase family 2 protein [Bacillota bacterium]